MTELLQRVQQNIQNRQLFQRGQKILVAVSGGLDSVALLFALQKISAKFQLKIVVAHFNHCLRGRSSDTDEKFVRKTAAAMKLPVFVGRAKVKDFACKSKLSIEMAARKLRHEFFARIARAQKIKTMALAHHADDQVELFFLRLLRGAGGAGLAGMKWRSPSPANPKIRIIRPLLNLTKSELRDFARENKIQFREDATNFSNDFLRNRVRNELLPLLKKKYQPALDKTILRLMEIIGAESDFVCEAAKKFHRRRSNESQIKNRKQKIENKLETRCLVSSDFEKLPTAIQRRILQLQLTELGVAAGFELIESLRQSPDVFASVSPKFSVSRDANGKVHWREQQMAEFNDREMAVKLNKPDEVIFGGMKFRWQIQPQKKFPRLRNKLRRLDVEFFDADKIGSEIVLRHWCPGDRFQPIGLKSPVKLQDLFTNQKIPRQLRHNLVLAATASGKIFWVEELRISEQFKLSPQTKRRLVWNRRRLN
ncbi:MAG: tRNA lysidine(34) synthetase TilS [Limisphaerales bacterium]